MMDAYHQLVCHVVMAWCRDNKLSIRVEKGAKPKLKTSEDGKSCLISVPSDTFVNWPPIKAELNGGYVVTVQRLQQQYKIELKHFHERKPDLILYSSSFTHEKDIKTQIKEMNSSVTHIGIAGPNLDVCGVLKGVRMTLEASSGTMHVNAKILAERLSLHAQNVVVAPEALVSASRLKVISRKLQIDGKMYPSETEKTPRHMDIVIDSGLVHLGVDGCLGESNEKENSRPLRRTAQSPTQITTDTMSLRISGSMANYGKVVATEKIELAIGGSILSLADGTFDSAGRGYGALKQIRGINSAPECPPSSSRLQTAILSENTAAAAKLIESGVDLNDKVNRKKKTLRQTAASMYRDKVKESTRNGVRQNITLINALFTVHDWRRGTIAAHSIVANIGKNCDDCAQFAAQQLQLNVVGRAGVEEDSIWACTWVEIEVGTNLLIAGQIKQRSLIVHCGGDMTTTQNGIVSQEIFSRITCKSFTGDGIWTVGERLSIDALDAIDFHQNSHLESEKLEIACDGTVNINGSWQVASGWAKVAGLLTVGPAAKIFVEETLSSSAQSLFCHGFINVTDSCDLQLRSFAHFLPSSKLECNVLNLVCEAVCTLGGLWIADTLQVYARQELITTSTGKAAVFTKASVTTGAFRNDANWQVEKDCNIIAGEMEQSDDGLLFVKQTLELAVHSDSLESWTGRIICSRLTMKAVKHCCFDGYLRANDVDVYLPYAGESQVVATGQWDILSGPLTLKGNSDFSSCASKPPSTPGFVLKGKMTASAIVAPFIAVELSNGSVARLLGISSPHPEIEFNVLATVGSLHMRTGSSLLSMSTEARTEGIICATSFHHYGQIRFNAEFVHLLLASWINKGRMTNIPQKQNHIKNCTVIVEELLLNEGTLATDTLRITGEGVLDNRGRIFAADTMDIRLKNFDNEEGIMESKNKMHLLSATSDWTKLAGAVRARKVLDLCATRLQVAVKDASSLSKDETLSFSARSELILSSAVIDENRRLAVGLAAQRSIVLDAPIETDRLEVILGGHHVVEPVVLKIKHGSDIVVNSLVINGEATDLRVVIDGNLSCNRLSIGHGFKNVLIAGKGQIEINSLQAKDSSLGFDLYQLIALGDISAKAISILKDSILRPTAFHELDTTSLISEKVYIDGTLFVESKIFIGSAKHGNVFINGSVIGSSVDSELSLEAGQVVIAGQVANLKFLEIYAKDRCQMQNAKLKNITGAAIDSLELVLSGEVEGFGNIVANCVFISYEGATLVSKGISMSLFATTITSNVHFEDCEKITIGARRSATLSGWFKNIAELEVDAKWMKMQADVVSCRKLAFTAWSLQIKANTEAASVSCTALGVILLSGKIASLQAKLISPFVICLEGEMPETVEVHSLVLLSGVLTPVGLTYLHLCFEESILTSKITPSQIDAWKDTGAMMKDRFSSATVEVEEMLLGLKYISDLKPIRVELDTFSTLYKDLTELCSKFEKNPISLFSVSDLVAIIHTGWKQFSLSTTPEKQAKKNKRSTSGLLYESLAQFRATRYAKENRGSVDVDGGYASRSSSEDLDVKDRPSSSSSGITLSPEVPLFEPDHLEKLEERLCQTPTTAEATHEELNASFLEEDELLEFEELEQEIEEAENGVIRTDFILCKEQKIHLARLHQKTVCILPSRPRPQFPLLRAPSSNDLVMKRFKVKNTLSTLDLRSFGSESSLASLDFTTTGDFGSPMTFPASPFQRSRIPQGSFRSPRKPVLLEN